jgi:catechol 2,3-dioxygenase-like lactoylglutathione lyase family enzyme
MFEVCAFDHVNVSIPKEAGATEVARAFYFDFLKLQEIEKPAEMKNRTGFWCACGDLQLHVSLEDFAYRAQTKAHFAIRIKNMDDFLKKAKDLGVSLQAAESLKGRRFHLRDPFGNRIELVEFF